MRSLSIDQISCSLYQTYLYFFFFQIMHTIEDFVFMFNIKRTLINLVHPIAVSHSNCNKEELLYISNLVLLSGHLVVICFWTLLLSFFNSVNT